MPDKPGLLKKAGHLTFLFALLGGLIVLQPIVPGFQSRIAAFSKTSKIRGEGAGVLDKSNPVELADLAGNKGVDRLFHDQAISGLLEFKIGAQDPTKPRQVVFVDHRMSLLSRELWNEYTEISRGTAETTQRLSKWNIDGVLLEKEKQEGLMNVLQNIDGWHQAAETPRHRLYLRSAAR